MADLVLHALCNSSICDALAAGSAPTVAPSAAAAAAAAARAARDGQRGPMPAQSPEAGSFKQVSSGKERSLGNIDKGGPTTKS